MSYQTINCDFRPALPSPTDSTLGVPRHPRANSQPVSIGVSVDWAVAFEPPEAMLGYSREEDGSRSTG
jgi:hypothetical protein